MAMILQLDVSSLGALALGFHAVLVRGDAGVDEKDEMDDSKTSPSAKAVTSSGRGVKEATENSHNQPQKHIPRNLCIPGRINLWIAELGEEILLEVAGDEAVNVELDGLPVPDHGIGVSISACAYVVEQYKALGIWKLMEKEHFTPDTSCD